jgi:hypothetical protein
MARASDIGSTARGTLVQEPPAPGPLLAQTPPVAQPQLPNYYAPMMTPPMPMWNAPVPPWNAAYASPIFAPRQLQFSFYPHFASLILPLKYKLTQPPFSFEHPHAHMHSQQQMHQHAHTQAPQVHPSHLPMLAQSQPPPHPLGSHPNMFGTQQPFYMMHHQGPPESQIAPPVSGSLSSSPPRGWLINPIFWLVSCCMPGSEIRLTTTTFFLVFTEAVREALLRTLKIGVAEPTGPALLSWGSFEFNTSLIMQAIYTR